LDKLIGSAWYSSEKISRELGYRPAYTLKNALPEIVAEFGKNS
jgi:nucleoside-diphosphate-sugar epimerase